MTRLLKGDHPSTSETAVCMSSQLDLRFSPPPPSLVDGPCVWALLLLITYRGKAYKWIFASGLLHIPHLMCSLLKEWIKWSGVAKQRAFNLSDYFPRGSLHLSNYFITESVRHKIWKIHIKNLKMLSGCANILPNFIPEPRNQNASRKERKEKEKKGRIICFIFPLIFLSNNIVPLQPREKL